MFAIQRRTIEIGAPEDLTLGRREVERRQKVRRGGETLDVRKMTQHLGEAVRHMNKLRKEKKKKRERDRPLLWTQLVEGHVRADQLAFGPSVERGMGVGPEEGFQGLRRCIFGDD